MPPEDEELIGDMPGEQPGQDEGQSASAESSAAQGAPEPDTLSLVRDVVAAAVPGAAVSPTEGQEAGQQPDPQAPQTPGAEDYDGLPFSRHPRFRQLISERKDLLKETERLKEFEQDAERYRNVQTFLETNNVSAEEAGQVLQIAARAKLDPAGAFEQLRPIVEDLMTRAGVLLPPDLQQAVQAGTYTPEVAAELSRARAVTKAAETREAAMTTRQTQDRQAQEVTGLRTAAESWGTERQAKDPGFATKMDALGREVAWLQRSEGVPNTPQGVREQLDKAYKAVNERLPPAAPPQIRKPIRPVVGGQVNGNAKPVINSTLELIRAKTGQGARA